MDPKAARPEPNSPEEARGQAISRLARPIWLTQIGMVAERAARCFWPLWTVLLIVMAALFFGLHELGSVELVWFGGLVGLVGVTWTLARGISQFHWPHRRDAVARLDESLPGRPIQTLADSQAIGAGDAASVAVWRAHVMRMADRLKAVSPVKPDVALAPRDPYALRFVALTAFALALLFGSVWRVATVSDVALGGSATAAVTGPSWEGWVEPPAYTGKPSLYLNDIAEGPLDVPAGSSVNLRLYGAVGELTVAETVSGRVGDVAPASDIQQQFDITQNGQISIAGPGGRTWQITLLPDTPPSVALEGAPEREPNGQMSQGFRVQDDYGIMGGTGLFTLDLGALDRSHGLAADPDPREPLEIDLPLPISGDRREFSEAIIENFSKHPWAGLPVTLTLNVVDEAEQNGTSAPEAMLLPGRRFFDPLAAALIEQRRDLLWARDNGARVAQVLRTVSHRPDDIFRDSSAYLQLRIALSRLEAGVTAGMTPDLQDEIAEALWVIALGIEEGDLASALDRLRRIQDQLSEAIRNGASDEEIAGLMQELREAMQDYMRQLAQQQDPNQQQQNAENGQTITGDQLQEMLDRLQQLMEEGRTAEAQELLNQLNQMMENMQVTQGQQGQGGQSPGEQAMEGLAETLREQQGLSDEAFRDLQEQFNPGANQGQSQQNQGRDGQQGQGQQHSQQQGEGQGQGQQPGAPQQPGQGQGQQNQPPQDGQGGGPNASDLAQRQQQLRQELQRQQGNLPGAGTEQGDAARRSLDEAGEAMNRAERDLEGDNLSGAIDNQAQAMDALREGMRNLGEAMAQEQRDQNQNGQQGQTAGRADPNGRRDPLGRDRGPEGTLGTEENLLQGEDVYRRARDLLDEIRRRSSDQERPANELDYLKRLLDRF
ncbi:TIGR02302 family protein [Actibacterium sp. 188UL27-1]|uniref:TIGR02302 family protein n=1 Tax=Actibacterium sp. 188UL27-1 TaxID=2786961 RepID=UPI0019585F3E|nr:TIGR02302 family protein [Actibacterium sp. 188UL27-1]MBM7066325.1 TIGR02302 family protein [Actibacterium sp. 188UL27-1]